jgi:hypothetical protein
MPVKIGRCGPLLALPMEKAGIDKLKERIDDVIADERAYKDEFKMGFNGEVMLNHAQLAFDEGFRWLDEYLSRRGEPWNKKESDNEHGSR